MFVTALEQLRELAASRRYKEAANLLAAVEELNKHFESLAKIVPKVNDLLQQKKAMIGDLKAQIFEDYDALLLNPLIGGGAGDSDTGIDWSCKIRLRVNGLFDANYQESDQLM